jgi:hypothetical protein
VNGNRGFFSSTSLGVNKDLLSVRARLEVILEV